MTAKSATDAPSAPSQRRIESRVFLVRGEKVLVDSDLAALYGVTTKALNQAVRRNADRFPGDFAFRLTRAESEALLRSQSVTSKLLVAKDGKILRSQIVTSKKVGSGGRRYLPLAFTEQGVAMLSSVLRSPRAVAVNIEIMRTFVRLREMIATHADLARKLDAMEGKYDKQFKVVFDALRELMEPAEGTERELGFHTLLSGNTPDKSKD
jgi:hypothetical protein